MELLIVLLTCRWWWRCWWCTYWNWTNDELIGGYTVTVGGGGANHPLHSPGPSYDGNPSSFGSITALGGGNGGGYPHPIIHIDKEDLVDLVVEPRESDDSPPDRGGASPPGGSGASGKGIRRIWRTSRTYSPGNKQFVVK